MCFGLNDIDKFPAKRPHGPVNLYNDLVSSISRRTERRIVAEFCRWRKTGKEEATGRQGDVENGQRVYSFRPHSPRLPVALSPVSVVFAVFSTTTTRVVSRVTISDCENATGLDHREARP